MSAREEAERRWPARPAFSVSDYDGHVQTGDLSKPYRDAFEAGAAWARENHLRDALVGLTHDRLGAAVAPAAAGAAWERERIAREIEAAYLGPDSGRSFDGRDAPGANELHAYDEGLERAARIARGQA